MNKKIAAFLDKINFRKIIKDLIYLYIISASFVAIYHLSYDSNPILRNDFASEINGLFPVLIILKSLYELFMAISSETYDGWRNNKNVVYEHSQSVQALGIASSKSNKEIADYNNRITTIHEAGHAIMA